MQSDHLWRALKCRYADLDVKLRELSSPNPEIVYISWRVRVGLFNHDGL